MLFACMFQTHSYKCDFYKLENNVNSFSHLKKKNGILYFVSKII